MKFIHTADWHLGKLVHGIYMTEDQAYILEQFINIVEEEKPDAIVIAGDLYDRSVPPTEAVELLEKTLFRLNVDLNIPILAISGNHDSAERLSFGSSWYKHNQFYMQGRMLPSIEPVEIGDVHFYLVPYAEPAVVRQAYEDPTITSHEKAMIKIVSEIEKTIDESKVNVFVGHAFVTGGKTSDSERTLSVGGTGSVAAEVFEPFDYVALGHLHSPDAIKHPTIKYSGSLLKYSFSEATQRKIISVIEVDDSKKLSHREIALKPQKDMRIIEGHLNELLDPMFYSQQKTEDYLNVVLLDEGAILDPMSKLRQVYPNVLHLERKIERTDGKKKLSFQAINGKTQSELSLFTDFYEQMTTATFNEEKKKILASVIDQVKQEEKA